MTEIRILILCGIIISFIFWQKSLMKDACDLDPLWGCGEVDKYFAIDYESEDIYDMEEIISSHEGIWSGKRIFSHDSTKNLCNLDTFNADGFLFRQYIVTPKNICDGTK